MSDEKSTMEHDKLLQILDHQVSALESTINVLYIGMPCFVLVYGKPIYLAEHLSSLFPHIRLHLRIVYDVKWNVKHQSTRMLKLNV